MSEHKGLRYNGGKLRYDLVQPFAHQEMVKVLTKGAEKYAPRNWERGMAWSNVIASLKRHMAAMEAGEDYDPETGLLHAAHIACNAHFLTAYYKIYPQGDDRVHDYLNRPKIGLDIDEVLCDWVGGWTERWNMERPDSWFFDREIVVKFDQLKSEKEMDDFYLSLKPLIPSTEVPFEPHCYVTSRPVETKTTEQWLDKYGYPARPVHTVGLNETKIDVLKRENVDIFVDDRYENFVEINNAGICCFLMDAAHNQRYSVGYRRIKSLKDIM